jgi:hypothetical protein
MRYSFLTAAFVFIFFTADAQNSAGVYFSQNFSTFRFRNSGGNLIDMAYTFKYGYGINFNRNIGSHFSAEAFLAYNYRGANSTSEHELVDWQFHYANAGLNAMFSFGKGKARPYLGTGLYYGYLIRADQFFGETYFNLIAEGNLTRHDFGVNLLAGLEYRYADFGSVYLRANEALGLYQLEDPAVSSQKLYNRTFSISLGMQFAISRGREN